MADASFIWQRALRVVPEPAVEDAARAGVLCGWRSWQYERGAGITRYLARSGIPPSASASAFTMPIRLWPAIATEGHNCVDPRLSRQASSCA
jgi:hypothetical protein